MRRDSKGGKVSWWERCIQAQGVKTHVSSIPSPRSNGHKGTPAEGVVLGRLRQDRRDADPHGGDALRSRGPTPRPEGARRSVRQRQRSIGRRPALRRGGRRRLRPLSSGGRKGAGASGGV